MSDSKHARLVAVALAVLSAVAACMPYDLKQVLDGPQGKALDISPTATVIPVNGGVTFTGNGGIPPYVYSIVSGGGTLDPVSGAYIAPVVTGTAVIRVTDKTGRGANATVAIQAVVTTLAISPGALSLAVGSNVTFSANGGTPPYTFILQTNVSGSPGVGSTSGLYVAGPTPGTDVVRVTDSAAGVATGTVTVTALTSAVDYTIPTTSFPPSGTVSTAVPGGYTFTVKNSGSIPGSQPVDWKVYLSANTVLDGGDILIDSGTIGALAPLASTPVTIAGSFPAVTPGPWYLIAQVSAADDTTQVNNTSGAGAFTLLPKNIDYSIAAVAHSTGTVAGASMTGSLTLHNGGNADGGATVSWAVYASTDTVLDGADYLLAFGSRAGVPALSSTAPISFNGYWPSTPGTWYLLAVVSASDDIGPANNTGYSAAVTTTGPGPANVDYTVLSVLNAGGTTAGDAVSGSFTIHNGGSDSGSLPVFWTAYLSSNATLELGTDQVIDSGSTTALANGATSGSIGFARDVALGARHLAPHRRGLRLGRPGPRQQRHCQRGDTDRPPGHQLHRSFSRLDGRHNGGRPADRIPHDPQRRGARRFAVRPLGRVPLHGCSAEHRNRPADCHWLDRRPRAGRQHLLIGPALCGHLAGVERRAHLVPHRDRRRRG